jgi:hypothetical protein
MTDDTQHVAIADFSLLVRRAEKAASDALTAVEAMERLFAAVAPRLDAIEGRLDSLERRQSVLYQVA